MIHCLMPKFTLANAVPHGHRWPSWSSMTVMANTDHASRFGQFESLSVRLFLLIYIKFRHELRLFDACNINFFFKILRFEKQIFAFFWIMLKVIISFSARTERRRRQSKKIFEKGVKMRLCFACSLQNFRCVANRNSDNCVKCVEIDLLCDLIVTAVDWNKFDEKRNRIRAEIIESLSELKKINVMQKKINNKQQKINDKLSHFRDFEIKLQTKVSEMIARESKNIKKMKADELSVEFIDIFFDFESFDLVLAALLSDFFAFSLDLNFFDDTHSEAF